VKYPLARTVTFNTSVTRFLDDSEQRYSRRKRLDFFALRLSNLPKSELDKLYAFWEDVRGPLVKWKITVDGVPYDNCQFVNDDFTFEELEDTPELYSVSPSAKQTLSTFDAPTGAMEDFPTVLDGAGRSMSAPVRRFQRPIKT